MAFFKKNVAVDLGTVNVVIYVAGQGIVLREPSLAVVSDDKYRDILAVGTKAKNIALKTPAGIREIYPVFLPTDPSNINIPFSSDIFISLEVW